jgi:Uma2 family endonuclease
MIRPGQLTLKFRPGLRLSDETFRRLCRANPNLRLERTANGELVVMPPSAPESSRRNMSLGAQLWNWNRQTGLGVVFDSSAGFTLPNTAIRAPDATWMTREHWDELPRDEREKFALVCPARLWPSRLADPGGHQPRSMVRYEPSFAETDPRGSAT